MDDKELEERAIDIFGRDEYDKMIAEGKSILDYMLKSNCSVRIVPNKCDRCSKKFRLWRKRIYTINGRGDFVCKDCLVEGEPHSQW